MSRQMSLLLAVSFLLTVGGSVPAVAKSRTVKVCKVCRSLARARTIATKKVLTKAKRACKPGWLVSASRPPARCSRRTFTAFVCCAEGHYRCCRKECSVHPGTGHGAGASEGLAKRKAVAAALGEYRQVSCTTGQARVGKCTFFCAAPRAGCKGAACRYECSAACPLRCCRSRCEAKGEE